jgi:hypothetical protein
MHAACYKARMGSSNPSVVVATHGHCFDGMCSAALFTRMAPIKPGSIP